MNAIDPSLELKPLVAPEPLLPQQMFPEWAWYAMAAGVIVLTALIIVIARMTRKRADQKAPENIRQLAYGEAIATLDSATPQERIQEVAVTISSAIRRYLTRVSGDPTLYETHEEFISRHEVLTRYPEELRKAASDLFTELARLKYGQEATGNAETLVTKARALLENLHSVRAA